MVLTPPGRDRRRCRRWLIGAMLLAAPLIVDAVCGQNEAPRPGGAMQVPPALPGQAELRAVRIDPALRRLVRELDDDAFNIRRDAMDELRRSSIDVKQICALLADDDISIEQRCRLLSLLEERLTRAPRGALGISLVGRSDELGGIEVLDLVKGMPSRRALRIGDRITHVDGRPVRRGDELIILIQGKQPGEETILTVLREKRDEEGRVVRNAEGSTAVDELRVAVELGSAADLTNPDPALPLRPGPVEAAREAEMNEAMRRYAPRPVPILLREGAAPPDFIAASSADHALRSVSDARNVLRDLQIQLLLIADGRLDRNETLLRTWRRQLEALEALAGDEALSETDRAAVRAIADRFAELIAG
jgi:hypothetical protein